MLARREHSREELLRKLRAAGIAADAAKAAVDEVTDSGAQSDERYVESIVRGRHARGYGPMRIRQELAAQGIAGQAVEQVLADYDWAAALTAAHDKKFGRTVAANPKDYAARARFLTYRGFAPGAVSALLRHGRGGDDTSWTDD